MKLARIAPMPYAPAKKGSTSDQILITSTGADQKKVIR